MSVVSNGAALPLTASSRALLAGGFALVVAGLVTGELFALLQSHAINAELRSAWQDVLALAGQADAGAIARRFEDIERLATARARAMSLHSHFGPYGLLAAALALVKTRLGFTSRSDGATAALLLTGGLLHPLGFPLLNDPAGAGPALAMAGVVLLVLGLVLFLRTLLRHRVDAREQVVSRVPGRGEAGSRILLIGAGLVLLGLVFGLYLAWRHVFFEEPALHTALRDLIVAIAAGNGEAAQSLYATYKSTQIRMAITAASHSHAVAFGLIMICVAFTTPYLCLSTAWRRIAFVLISTGGLLLPVFVYLAPRFGYVFALCADSAGGLVILGLVIVLVGLIPRRGAS